MLCIPLEAFEMPPKNQPFILVLINPGSTRITTSAQVSGPGGGLVDLGPYAFAAGDLDESLGAAMEAAQILSNKYGIPIYLRDERKSEVLPH